MKYTPELKGKTFERWTIIGPSDVEEKNYNKFRVKCQCQCGTIKDVLWRSLYTGKSKSCGCYNLEVSKSKLEQIIPIGSTFGKWTVVGESKKEDGRTKYPCQCECGTTRLVERYSLVSGKSMSCGCLQSKGEFLINEWLKKNGFNYKTQFSFEDCLSPKNRKLKFDFAIFNDKNELSLIIEFQGSQHTILNPKNGRFLQTKEKFDTTQSYDEIKYNYLKDNNLPYLYISYKDIRNIEDILYDKLIKRVKFNL